MKMSKKTNRGDSVLDKARKQALKKAVDKHTYSKSYDVSIKQGRVVVKKKQLGEKQMKISKENGLSGRMKRYEKVSSPELYRKIPVIVRVDGRAFYTFTRKFKRPYDENFIKAMLSAARAVAEDMQGFKLGYVQSDEASFLLTDYDNIESQPWFDNDLSKIVSIASSLMSVYFNSHIYDITMGQINKQVVFDARAFNLPKEEVANYFLFRSKDWERNSLQMYARSIFSHKELNGKKRKDIHEMLHIKGRNWTKDVPLQEKNGTFFYKGKIGLINKIDILPNYESVSALVETFI